MFGKYEVIRRLAAGGMGEIFLARQVGVAQFDRLVILKSLLRNVANDKDMLGHFLDEARIVGSINHPNVVACYEVGEWEGVYFIAMEYVNGVDVAHLQRVCGERQHPFPVNVALSIAREAALGLDSAHHATDVQGRSLRIVHRDISPHNLMVRLDGLTKVVDFGVAMVAKSSQVAEPATLRGKVGYMAPEQIRGLPLDGRADQFSLGVVLWELLVGRRLFVGDTPEQTFMKVLREAVPAPGAIGANVGADVDALVLRMTAQDPAARFPRLADVAAQLRRILDQRRSRESEAEELVRDLAGTELADRMRDFAPGASPEGGRATRSSAEGRQTPAQARSGGQQPQEPAVTQPDNQGLSTDMDGAELLDGDMLDVAIDDATGPRESAAVVGIVELVDGGGAHVPHDAMMPPIWAALDDVAHRYGGAIKVQGNRLTATFAGDGRAARSAMAFARRAGSVVVRAHRDLRLRAGVGARPGLAFGDDGAHEDATRIVFRARAGQLLVADRARRLTSVRYGWGPGPTLMPEDQGAGGGRVEGPLPTSELPVLPVFHGRSAERVSIEQAIASADLGRGQQLLLLGAPGSGRTRLLQLAASEARDRGFIVAMARCARSSAVLHFDVVRQLIRQVCDELVAASSREGSWLDGLDGLALTDHQRRKLVAVATAESLGEEVPPARRRVLLRSALVTLFTVVARRHGVCILLDDVERCDGPSLELLASVGARLAQARCALVAVGRPVRGERALPLAKRLAIDPLDDKDINAIVTSQLSSFLDGHPQQAPLASHISVAARGSPARAMALLALLEALGLLWRGAPHDPRRPFISDDAASFPLPEDDATLARARRLLLSESSSETLDVAQLWGRHVAMDVLVAATSREAVDRALIEWRHHDLLEAGDAQDASPQLVLRADLAARSRDTAADPPAPLAPSAAIGNSRDSSDLGWIALGGESSFLHARVADALERISASPNQPTGAATGAAHPSRRLAAHADSAALRELSLEREERLAHHRARSGEWRRATEHAVRAADGWARLGLVEASRVHYQDVIRAHWRSLRAEREDHHHVAADVEAPGAEALALAARATTCVAEIDPALVVDWVLPPLRATPAHVADAERAQAVAARVHVLLRLRRPEDALAMIAEVAPALSGAPLGVVQLARAAVLEAQGNFTSAHEQFSAAQGALQVLVKPESAQPLQADEQARHLLAALMGLGRTALRLGRPDEARAAWELALQTARRARSSPAVIDALSALSTAEQHDHNGERALELLTDALSVAAAVGDGVAEARLRQQVARVLEGLGRMQEAVQAANVSVEVARAVGWEEGLSVAQQLAHGLAQKLG